MEKKTKQYMLNQKEFEYNPEICLPRKFEVSEIFTSCAS